ncbi:MAG: ABC transporter permease [Acidobacteria bacterium]|nr:ABC transporter permease [Acidobacteriota bacterium]MBI3656132.1 ABC transporter permease [Acidobacteriota bacterium]
MSFRHVWIIFKMSLRALARNKVRSFLTMLGIIIGVGAVIAMVSLGQGAQRQVQEEIASMGTNILYVRAGSMRSYGVHTGSGSLNTLTPDDIEAILRECPSVQLATPNASSMAQVVYGNQNWSTRVEGFNEKFPEIRNWPVDKGEFFTETHVKTAARVVVLGKTVADKLFPSGDAIGQMIRIRNLPFRVLGVLSRKGENSWGRDQDDTAIVPYSTIMKKLLGGINYIQQAMISARSPRATYTAEVQVKSLLRQRHRLGSFQEDDFSVRNMGDIAETYEATNRTMTILLGSIAAVSLIVGGIGIMNIMLVAVSERTREIGVRMAIGARPGHVRIQFLTESIVLCILGGLLGISLGVIASYAIANFLMWPTLISSWSIMVSVIFSISIGLFFGYYPAHKAASLDPINALRYE